MKRFSEQLKKKSDSIRLRAAEKHDLRERLVAYMEYHPITPVAQEAVLHTVSTAVTAPTESFPLLTISRWLVRGFGGAMALFLVLVPVLAERSVPGDSLYAVKVNVNEEVWSSLAFSSFEKIEWETKRLERRIAEAQVLARSGRLTPEVEASVVGAVEGHRLSAAASIEKLRTVDAERASLAEMTLSAVLDVQSAKLSSNSAASSTDGRSTAALAQAVATSREEAEVRSASASISYDRLMAHVEQETTRTYELLDSIRETAPTEQVEAIERRLRDIERSLVSVVTARADIETKDTVPVMAVSIAVATTTDTTSSTSMTTTVVSSTTEQVVANEDDLIHELRATFKAIQKLIAYMTDIDLQSTVQIEALVPVVLTDEEALAEVTTLQQQLSQQIILLENAIPALPESGQENIQTSIETAERLLAASETASQAAAWGRARAYLAEADAFVQSMQKIFSLEDVLLLDPSLRDATATSSATTIDQAVSGEAASVADGASERG